MAEGPPRKVGASWFWSTILSSALQGSSMGAMYAQIKHIMALNNLQWNGYFLGDVSRSRGYANRIARASRRLNAAPPGTTIDESMIAPWIGFVPTTASNLNPRYDVKWLHRVMRDGQEVTEWRTWADYPNPFIDNTVLQDELESVGLYLARKYKAQHLGVDSFYIVQVPS